MCILVAGPESSGTRFIAGMLSQHPQIYGSDGDHEDVLDAYWDGFDDGALGRILENNDVILTRRSIPSGRMYPNREDARYLHFDDFQRLYEDCRSWRCDLVVLITTRSPKANFLSWARSRSSVGRSIRRARTQYQEAYKHLFRFVLENDNIPFYLASLEACLAEGEAYFKALFNALGLPEFAPALALDPFVNLRQYFYAEMFRTTRLRLGKRAYFGQGQLGMAYCVDGWSPPERAHVWTVGHTSRMLISIDREESEGCKISFDVKVFTVPGKIDAQHVTFISNQIVLFQGALASDGIVTFEVPFTEICDCFLPLTIILPNASRPADFLHGSGDDRCVAIGLKSVVLHGGDES